ncbi:glycosyltransferase family 4 protein [Neobacillus ginsengisoli]|uniref:Glycosyltransferase involved in cell wall biosynthesis n=1 Tax=Neobacillus ginsengisoli TaxID=904295 RepID=A0ABT9XQQ0_9BACI|nr:glycosyltransferase family 4 protein [Neobacillus ginsengisoli]MDQ0197294.1 glycosyltransferase involved in cell wall biosynthesis [Neobacillus ginsengisoli]
MSNVFSQHDKLEQKPAIWRHMKILMLCWEYPPNIVGGLSRHVNGLSVQLAKMGHDVHVLTAGDGDLAVFEKMDGVNVHRIKPLNEQDNQFFSWIGGLNLAFVFKAEKLAEEIGFNLIHAHDWLVGTAAIVLKETLSIPLLTTIHATEYGRNNGIHTGMQQFIHDKEHQLIGESNQIIVCSEYMRDELIPIFKVSNKIISVIPNGIDPLSNDIEPSKIFPFLSNKKYVFSLGRMVQEKGFETIIDAAMIAKEKKLDIYFVIAGKGPMLESYRRQVIEKDVENKISFVGFINDEQRNALLLKSEIAVFPSLYEPFGIVALESMVLGIPTIVSDTGGLKGIVKHLQTGLLMVPGDPISLLEQIEFLIQNPVKAEEMGRRGRHIVKSLYGWKRIAYETSKIMEDTLLSQRVNDREKVENTESPNNL